MALGAGAACRAGLYNHIKSRTGRSLPADKVIGNEQRQSCDHQSERRQDAPSARVDHVHVVVRVAKFDLVAGITHLIVTASPQRFWHSNGADPWLRCARQVFLERERPKTELKSLMPEDAKEAIGPGHLPDFKRL